MPNVFHPADIATFVFLIFLNIGLGLYFALCRGLNIDTTKELFLGSRSLQMLPLALSTMAGAISGVGVIGFTAHFYIYGLHVIWTTIPVVVAAPFFSNVILSVLYKLQVTSLFEVRRRKRSETYFLLIFYAIFRERDISPPDRRKVEWPTI